MHMRWQLKETITAPASLKNIVFVAILGCVLFFMTEHKACEFETLVFVLTENFESNVTYLKNIHAEQYSKDR